MAFRDIIGHRRTIGLLARAVAHRTLPPSLIFAGPAGVGKWPTAVALGQALNCLAPLRDVPLPHDSGGSGLPLDACGECGACRRFARGVHPDLVHIVPDADTGNIRIEAIRDLTERIGYRPFEARWRVAIIDAAERLGEQAQNALLKTLEEPPSTSVFVLITAHADELLPTVRSRCPLVRFGPLAPAAIARHLEEVHQVPAATAHALASVSDGSLGAALGAGSDAVVAARRGAQRLLEQVARARDPHARLRGAQEIVGKTAKGFGAGERESVSMHLRVLQALLRDVGVLSVAGEQGTLANADLRPALASLVPAFDSKRLVAAFTAIHRALEALGGNASPKVVADWVALQI